MLAHTGEDEFRVAFEDPHATTTLDYDSSFFKSYRFYTTTSGASNWKIRGAHMTSSRGYYLLSEEKSETHLIEFSYLSEEILREVQLEVPGSSSQQLEATLVWNQLANSFEYFSVVDSQILAFWRVDEASFEVLEEAIWDANEDVSATHFAYDGGSYRAFCY